MALTECFLRSMYLESSLVSISAFTFSVGSRGKGCSELLSNLISSGITSTPPGAFDEPCTIPLTPRTDSFLSLRISLSSSGEIFLLGAVI